MNGIRKAAQGESATLRPGVSMPLVAYLGSLTITVLAMVAVTFPGPHNHSLYDRWLGGQVLVVGAWTLYKLASNRIILGEDAMQIVSWGRIWTVCRGEVKSVQLTNEAFSLSIILRDGLVIRPVMFMASPSGVVYFRVSLFRNAMSRETIAARITEWNEQAHGVPAGEKPARPWRVRLNLPLLLIASAIIAAEAIILTAANVW